MDYRVIKENDLFFLTDTKGNIPENHYLAAPCQTSIGGTSNICVHGFLERLYETVNHSFKSGTIYVAYRAEYI